MLLQHTVSCCYSNTAALSKLNRSFTIRFLVTIVTRLTCCAIGLATFISLKILSNIGYQVSTKPHIGATLPAFSLLAGLVAYMQELVSIYQVITTPVIGLSVNIKEMFLGY